MAPYGRHKSELAIKLFYCCSLPLYMRTRPNFLTKIPADIIWPGRVKQKLDWLDCLNQSQTRLSKKKSPCQWNEYRESRPWRWSLSNPIRSCADSTYTCMPVMFMRSASWETFMIIKRSDILYESLDEWIECQLPANLRTCHSKDCIIHLQPG